MAPTSDASNGIEVENSNKNNGEGDEKAAMEAVKSIQKQL
jgi:hypothetical protein